MINRDFEHIDAAIQDWCESVPGRAPPLSTSAAFERRARKARRLRLGACVCFAVGSLALVGSQLLKKDKSNISPLTLEESQSAQLVDPSQPIDLLDTRMLASDYSVPFSDWDEQAATQNAIAKEVKRQQILGLLAKQWIDENF